MTRIANNSNEFITKATTAIQTVLNSEAGQEITGKLLEMKLKENPNMTAEEWNTTKAQFMVFIFNEYMKTDAQAMQELGGHIYRELRA